MLSNITGTILSYLSPSYTRPPLDEPPPNVQAPEALFNKTSLLHWQVYTQFCQQGLQPEERVRLEETIRTADSNVGRVVTRTSDDCSVDAALEFIRVVHSTSASLDIRDCGGSSVADHIRSWLALKSWVLAVVADREKYGDTYHFDYSFVTGSKFWEMRKEAADAALRDRDAKLRALSSDQVHTLLRWRLLDYALLNDETIQTIRPTQLSLANCYSDEDFRQSALSYGAQLVATALHTKKDIDLAISQGIRLKYAAETFALWKSDPPDMNFHAFVRSRFFQETTHIGSPMLAATDLLGSSEHVGEPQDAGLSSAHGLESSQNRARSTDIQTSHESTASSSPPGRSRPPKTAAQKARRKNKRSKQRQRSTGQEPPSSSQDELGTSSTGVSLGDSSQHSNTLSRLDDIPETGEEPPSHEEPQQAQEEPTDALLIRDTHSEETRRPQLETEGPSAAQFRLGELTELRQSQNPQSEPEELSDEYETATDFDQSEDEVFPGALSSGDASNDSRKYDEGASEDAISVVAHGPQAEAHLAGPVNEDAPVAIATLEWRPRSGSHLPLGDSHTIHEVSCPADRLSQKFIKPAKSEGMNDPENLQGAPSMSFTSSGFHEDPSFPSSSVWHSTAERDSLSEDEVNEEASPSNYPDGQAVLSHPEGFVENSPDPGESHASGQPIVSVDQDLRKRQATQPASVVGGEAKGEEDTAGARDQGMSILRPASVDNPANAEDELSDTDDDQISLFRTARLAGNLHLDICSLALARSLGGWLEDDARNRTLLVEHPSLAKKFSEAGYNTD